MRSCWKNALLISCFLSVLPVQGWTTTAESYYPPWVSELGWANNNLFSRPTGSLAWLEDSYLPWWQTRTAHPIMDYDASKLPVGEVRLDSALDAEVTFHRLLPGWTKQTSPTGINNVYTFTPSSRNQEDQTARAGQNAFFDLGVHPIPTISADIGAELIGNYDQRYWFPLNDEHRLFKDGHHAKIVRAQVQYDDKTFMLRGFDGVPVWGWVAQNDLFNLLPTAGDTEYFRRVSGSAVPRGGEMRYKSPFGTFRALGGTEIRWGFGSSAFAKYDAPVFGALEQSLVYRNENVPLGLESTDERRWAMSYNASYAFSERVLGHAGLLYQPFRLDRLYQDVDGSNRVTEARTKSGDALGGAVRTEIHPTRLLDLVGMGYLYEGPVAGNKQQVDVDATKTVWTDWTLSGAYEYHQPVKGPVPFLYEGTTSNPGALVAIPRGPDDPFGVQWDNRKAHIGSLTLVYDPTPGSPFFRFTRNVLEDWNVNPNEDAPLAAAVQYRVTHYPTNTDRIYLYNEDRTLVWDFLAEPGAFATEHPFQSATGLVRCRINHWRVTADLSGGEALAGLPRVYSSTTTYYKPSSLYLSAGLAVDNGWMKMFARYGRDQWGPVDYHTQFGWQYHHIYQAGLSVVFLRDAEAGFRYIGTRMDNYIGSDTGAFNEYQFFLTYHFTLAHNFGDKLSGFGKPLPSSLPEASVDVSDAQFSPDGSGSVRTVVLQPKASASGGILSWQLFVRDAEGKNVRRWQGSGSPTAFIRWDGFDSEGQMVPAGAYHVTLVAVDLYGNESTSPAQPVTVVSGGAPKAEGPVAVPEAPVVSAPPAEPAVPSEAYTVKTTVEGLKVTLSSFILFDVNRAELKDAAKNSLDQVMDLLKAYPTNVLRISGYTDSVGSVAHNQVLSERRARSVADYLIGEGGIAKSRIEIVGYGKKRPVASNATEEGRLQNRRVEIDILK
ncbi:MAG: OmpA family protein [Elusimicrobiota bacterium]|jgi:outer membrane protein OmpA-like peptidoglycan-associated protein